MSGRKIALVRRNGLGDLLCAFPMVLYLKKKFPEDHLTLFVDARNAPLLPFLPPANKTVIFPSKGNKYSTHFLEAFRHRKHKFDLAISAKTSPMKLMNFFLFALGAKKRIAYTDSSWHSHLINEPVFYDESSSKNRHQALKGLLLLDPHLTNVPEEYYPKISVPPHLHSLYAPVEKSPFPILLLSASTTREASRLSPTRYAELVNRLHEKYPFSVFLVGQENDKERAFAISKRLKVPHNLHFPRNFDAFMVLLDLSDLYFIGDGGIGHIGAALGKEAVVLFGETHPQEWHPLSSKITCFYHPTHVDHLSDEKIFAELEKKMKCLQPKLSS